MAKKIDDVLSRVADEAVDQAREEAERRRKQQEELRSQQQEAYGASVDASASLLTKAGGHLVSNARYTLQTVASAVVPLGLGLSAGVMLSALLDHRSKGRKE